MVTDKSELFRQNKSSVENVSPVNPLMRSSILKLLMFVHYAGQHILKFYVSVLGLQMTEWRKLVAFLSFSVCFEVYVFNNKFRIIVV